MIAKKSCVDETILIKNLIRNNLEMFSNKGQLPENVLDEIVSKYTSIMNNVNYIEKEEYNKFLDKQGASYSEDDDRLE